MLKSLMSAAAGTVLAALLVTGAQAAAEEPKKATDMLFQDKHIANIAPGTELLYKFERKPSDEKVMGPGYTDEIKVKIEGEGAPGKKNVLVTVYTGERARDPNHITDMDGNPMLIVYLDTAVGHFQQLTGGDRGYLKNRFSKSLGSEAKAVPVKIDYKGAQVDGYKVTVAPYADDPARAKMRGFETSEFSIVLSEKIPGQFAQMTSHYVNTAKDAPMLDEKTTLDGVGEIK
jgi:hypothetical protein